jgi:hypothetical protein
MPTNTGALECSIACKGSVLKECFYQDSNNNFIFIPEKLTYNILNQNLIEKDADYFTKSGLSVQIYDASGYLIAPNKNNLGDNTTYYVKSSYYLTENNNKYRDDNTFQISGFSNDDKTVSSPSTSEIDISVDDYFIQDTDATYVDLDSILFFKNAPSELVGGVNAPISSDFNTTSTYLTDIAIVYNEETEKNEVQLTDGFKG